MIESRIIVILVGPLFLLIVIASSWWVQDLPGATHRDYLLSDGASLPACPAMSVAGQQLTPEQIKPFHNLAHSAFTEVAALLHEGRYAAALSLLGRSWDQRLSHDTQAEHWYLRGMALLGLKDYTAAGLSFMRVVVFHSGSARYGMALYRLAQIHERLNRFDVAYSLYREVSQLPSSAYDTEPRAHATRRLQKLELAFDESFVQTLTYLSQW